MERYTPGDSPAVTSFMARRTLPAHGSFFRPFLWPGAQVLDCGCGPGTITRGIAAAVSPGGTVMGIDANPAQIELAKQELPPGGNTGFHVASVYELPFASNRFDAIFSHALFEHLADPRRAARELRRVLKPGGVVGIRSPDWSGKLVWPSPEPVEQAVRFYGEMQASNGGDFAIGRKLASILRESGFVAIRATASYECYSPASLIAEYLARQIEAADADQDGGRNATELAAGLRAWAASPDAFFAQAWCEAVGEKERG